MVNVMGSAAQWEHRIIAQRTKDALAVKRAQGVRLGRPSALSEYVVALIVGWHEEGLSLSEIARRLNSENRPTAHGGARWHASTIRKVLQGQDARQWGSADAGVAAHDHPLGVRTRCRSGHDEMGVGD